MELVGHLEDPDACYSFDDIIVWKDKETGKLYYAEDSGCSCPSPFESETRETIRPLTDETWDVFQKAVEGHAGPNSWDDPTDSRWQSHAADKTELLAKVSRLLADKGA